jgi:formyltetrahydrofolate-dependent phosphoribosylglycinamide formyltransferase
VSEKPPAPARVLDLGVLLSGRGRTLENLLARIDAGTLSARVRVVVSDRDGAGGLAIAAARGIDAVVVRPKDYNNFTEEFSRAITYKLEKHPIDLVVMAGFLSLYKIPKKFQGTVMNIHPAPVPSFAGKGFYGERVHDAVLRRGVKVTGCTVHFCNNSYDEGPIILQKAVPIAFEDTAETIAAKVFAAECEAYPEAIQLFAEGRLSVEKSRVRILEPGSPPAPRGPAE